MSIVHRTSPSGDMLSLRQAMDRLFEAAQRRNIRTTSTTESPAAAEAATRGSIDVRERVGAGAGS
jgi:hypothetical protein